MLVLAISHWSPSSSPGKSSHVLPQLRLLHSAARYVLFAKGCSPVYLPPSIYTNCGPQSVELTCRCHWWLVLPKTSSSLSSSNVLSLTSFAIACFASIASLALSSSCTSIASAPSVPQSFFATDLKESIASAGLSIAALSPQSSVEVQISELRPTASVCHKLTRTNCLNIGTHIVRKRFRF